MTVDLEEFTYLRQDQKGVLLGIYEINHEHWAMDGAPWDYGMELFQEQTDRIENELVMGFERYPALQDVGIKTWVNGAFTFSPDGNPLVGPVPDKRGYWCACAVMAGFLQGGGVGKSLAEGGRLSGDIVGPRHHHLASVLLSKRGEASEERNETVVDHAKRTTHLELLDVLGEVARGHTSVDVLMACERAELIDPSFDIVTGDGLASGDRVEIDLLTHRFVGGNRVVGNVDAERALCPHHRDPQFALEHDLALG